MQQQISREERAQRILDCLEELGVRQIDIAESLNIRRGVVSSVIHGRDMSARVIEKLRESGVPSELLEGLIKPKHGRKAREGGHLSSRAALAAVGKKPAASAV